MVAMRFRRNWVGFMFLLAILCVVLSCGGGTSGGGGGGGDGKSYTVDVMVTSGNSNKTAGTITLTVN